MDCIASPGPPHRRPTILWYLRLWCVLCRVDKAVLLGRAPAGGEGDGDDGIGDDKTYASAASSRERRRLSIKAAKVRRRKQEVEITAMEAEDEHSKLENKEYRVS